MAEITRDKKEKRQISCEMTSLELVIDELHFAIDKLAEILLPVLSDTKGIAEHEEDPEENLCKIAEELDIRVKQIAKEVNRLRNIAGRVEL